MPALVGRDNRLQLVLDLLWRRGGSDAGRTVDEEVNVLLWPLSSHLQACKREDNQGSAKEAQDKGPAFPMGGEKKNEGSE